MTQQAARRRVLIVEDECLVAMLVEDMLIDMDHDVVGPAFCLEQALAIARAEDFDFAILDVNLAGEQSFPVAELLRERGIPFIFATGYGTKGLTDAFRGVVTLKKPFTCDEMQRAVKTACENLAA